MAIRKTARAGVVAVLAAAVTATAFSSPALAGSEKHRPKAHQETQRAMDALVRAGIPGVIAESRTDRGVWKGTSGVADLTTGKKRGTQDRFRAASITKTFVATVLLQQEADGLLSLDDTVEHWLPGVVRGNGNDGRKITVRQLLNHSSGLYEYTADPEYQRTYETEAFLKHRYDTVTPLERVRIGLAYQPDFAPGAQHQYSNTGYVLAGMIIEKVSGNSYEKEVVDRVLRPLGLRATTLPGDTVQMPRPSGRAYSRLSLDPAAPIHDVTDQNGSFSWADGDIISTTSDLTRFLRALLQGELLPPEQLRAMKTMLPADGRIGYADYGLGLYSYKTSCGVRVWGHSGGAPGSSNDLVGTEDGRHVVAVNTNGDWNWSQAIVDSQFCGKAVPKGLGKPRLP
ncbi:serine hydrolase domain-containing protein [Streptomyces sp. NPDC057638]|uniref:serine hydrolase domain-containing protein n=1 Tax=Streptomyces sp. NPDC057638 TaxID=3346190 RepID=UPI0036794CAB